MRYHWLSFLSVLTVAPLRVVSLTKPQLWRNVRVKHAWDAVPANWESLGRPHPNTTIDLYVALKPQNENALIDALYEVSTVENAKYGEHLSREEVAKLVAPHPDTLELVHSWLAHHNVPAASISSTHGGSWLTLSNVPVSQANELLNASYQVYRHAEANDSTILRTVGYALPSVLHAHVKTIAPTTFFALQSGAPRQASHNHSDGEAGAPAKMAPRVHVTELPSREQPALKQVTPEFLRNLYKTFAYTPQATSKNSIGITGFQNEFPNPKDLELFMSQFRSDAVDATYSVVTVNEGVSDPGIAGFEASLNIQYAEAMAYPTPFVFYSTGGRVSGSRKTGLPVLGDAWLAWLIETTDLEKEIPQTMSISYGSDETLLPREYTAVICYLLAQLGLRGVSVLTSSGDYGVGRGDCKAADGSVRFRPTFPSSCPYVTSVGGTTGILPEVAVPLSGGGFSDHFQQPYYQRNAVPYYLGLLGNRYRGMYNESGRGIPDISAQALNFLVYVRGILVPVSGTSCSAPTVAGMIALLNDFLLSEGGRPLGFLNPWLYGVGRIGLNDILSGSNPGCNTDGFSTATGWDPVTGLGTPDFFDLQHLIIYTILHPQAREVY